MRSTPEYIHQLMTEKLAGTISALDEQYLDELITTIPAINEKWQEIKAIFSQEDPGRELLRLKNKKWPESHELLKPPARVIPFYMKMAKAAASIAALLAIAWGIYAWIGKTGLEADRLVFNPPVQKHIELKLADGSSIDLSLKEGNIVMNDVQLKNDQKSLDYTAAETTKTGINTLSVPAGKDYKISLADGTEVWLNSTTTLEFPFVFNGPNREIAIDGEAYLKVAPDADKPFIVHLPESSVKVLGTEFNVNTYDPGTEKIALVEGSVNLKAPTQEITIKPGYQAIYTGSGGWSQETFDAEKVLGWRKGVFYFYDASLEDICRALTRWYGVTVIIDDTTIKTRRFAGLVDKKQPIEVFLDNLKAITAIDYYFEENGQVLHFRNPSKD